MTLLPLLRSAHRVRVVGAFLALLATTILGAPAVAADQTSGRVSGVTSVIDADTIEIHGVRIRLHGIDAPESRQECRRPTGETWRCGQQASLALQDHVERRPLSCLHRDTDHYGRMIGQCFLGDQDVNAWLVEQGWAVAYRRYSRDYVAQENAAKTVLRGIWSGDFIMPWDWRRGQRLQSAAHDAQRQPADPTCVIKGNINAKGERIYHVPGGRWYDQTRINESKGQRWFCSEDDAQTEGWRRSRQ